jgi:hypothetical protein
MLNSNSIAESDVNTNLKECYMKKLILIAAAIFFASYTTVNAATPTAVATWVAPTAYTDSTALPASQIAQYTVALLLVVLILILLMYYQSMELCPLR